VTGFQVDSVHSIADFSPTSQSLSKYWFAIVNALSLLLCVPRDQLFGEPLRQMPVPQTLHPSRGDPRETMPDSRDASRDRRRRIGVVAKPDGLPDHGFKRLLLQREAR
jgi:hypothetical protein